MNCKLIKTEIAWLKRLFQFIIMCLLLSVAAYESYAQDNSIRNGFTFGGNIGYGCMKINHDNSPHESDSTFALGLHGGYAITPKIIAGIELNGWTIKASNLRDPSAGEFINNYSMFVNVFPFEIPVYFTGGGGVSRYRNNSPDVDGGESGNGWFLGCGYEIPITDTFMCAPQIRYSKGNFSGGDYDVTEVSISFHWYSK
jgi:hypothetical protein